MAVGDPAWRRLMSSGRADYLIENPHVGADDPSSRIRAQRVRHRLEVLREPKVITVEGADERRLRERNAPIARRCRPAVLGLAVHPDTGILNPSANLAVSSLSRRRRR